MMFLTASVKPSYKDRSLILHGDDLKEQISGFVDEVLTTAIDERVSEGHAEDWDLDDLWEALESIYPVSITADDLAEDAGDRTQITRDQIVKEILADAHLVYDEREESVGEDSMREIERRVMLSTIGERWPEHLYEMDYLKEGIGLRAMAQRDPLVEYQREGYSMYQAMLDAIREETVSYLFNLDCRSSEPRPRRCSFSLRAAQSSCSTLHPMKKVAPMFA